MIIDEPMTVADDISDADLVARTLAGDRDAFSRIVSRHQILICSLAYSRIGHLGQSEDIAQETFITAWKHLRLLREPDKLRAWLCGIVRNRARKCLQREGREPVNAAEPLETLAEAPATEALPSEQTIGREEAAILWRALEKIPELYREPLVLFYRQHQSIEQVAAELDLTEDTVKQRLSRGRRLLQEEILTFVESALRKTAPSEAFASIVLAALPLAGGGGMAPVGASLAGKGTVVAKSGLLAACALPLVGVFTGFAAQWLMMRGDAGTMRRARVIALIGAWAFVLTFSIGGQFGVYWLHRHFGWSDRTSFAAQAIFWWFFAAVMASWIIKAYRQSLARIRSGVETGGDIETSAATMKPATCAAIVAGTQLMIFWGVIFMAWQTHDRLAATTIAGVMAAMGIWNYFEFQGRTGSPTGPVYLQQLASSCIALIIILNLRLDVWVANLYGISVATLHATMPVWLVPLLTLALALWTGMQLALTKPKGAAERRML